MKGHGGRCDFRYFRGRSCCESIRVGRIPPGELRKEPPALEPSKAGIGGVGAVIEGRIKKCKYSAPSHNTFTYISEVPQKRRCLQIIKKRETLAWVTVPSSRPVSQDVLVHPPKNIIYGVQIDPVLEG